MSALAAARLHPPARALAPVALTAVVAGPMRRLAAMGGRPGRYAYFRTQGRPGIVGLEAPRGVGLPLSIAVPASVVDAGLRAGSILLGRHVLCAGREEVGISVAVDARRSLSATAAACGRAADGIAARLAAAERPDEPAAVEAAVAAFGGALAAGDVPSVEAAARGLLGLGTGSTPAGDDVLAAAAATLAWLPDLPGSEPGLAAMRRAISGAPARTTPLSAALLACAADGHAVPALRDCVEAAVAGRDAAAAVRTLLRIGHSSGFFLATGAVAALRAAAAVSVEAGSHRIACLPPQAFAEPGAPAERAFADGWRRVTPAIGGAAGP